MNIRARARSLRTSHHRTREAAQCTSTTLQYLRYNDVSGARLRRRRLHPGVGGCRWIRRRGWGGVGEKKKNYGYGDDATLYRLIPYRLNGFSTTGRFPPADRTRIQRFPEAAVDAGDTRPVYRTRIETQSSPRRRRSDPTRAPTAQNSRLRSLKIYTADHYTYCSA